LSSQKDKKQEHSVCVMLHKYIRRRIVFNIALFGSANEIGIETESV